MSKLVVALRIRFAAMFVSFDVLVPSLTSTTKTQITSNVTFVLSSHATSSLLENTFVHQFNKELLAQINQALAASVPVLDCAFLERCLDAGRRLVPLPSEHVAAVVDMQRERANAARKVEPPSKLDERAQRMVQLVCDDALLQRTITELDIDERQGA